MDLSAEKLMADMMEISRGSPDPTDLLSRFGFRMKEMLSADEVIVKDFYHGKDSATQAEDFVLNTKKPYLDNRLSGYSAFADLINYFNSGFKSCLLLPVATDDRIFGVLTLLSRNEEGFDKNSLDKLALVSSLLGYESDARLERERSLSIAKYFDASFENAMPQFIIDKNGLIIKANKTALNLLDKTSKDVGGRRIDEFFALGDQSIERLRKGLVLEIKDKAGPREFKVSTKGINENLMHLLFYETTALNELQNRNIFFGYGDTEVFIMTDSDARVLWVSENVDKVMRVDQDALLGKRLTDFLAGPSLSDELNGLGDRMYSSYATLRLENNVAVDAKIKVFRSKYGFSVILSKDIEKYINKISKGLDDILKLSGDAVITIDGLGYIRGMNKSAERLLRYRAEELEGVALSSICAEGESRGRMETSLNLAKSSGIVTDLFVNFTRNGGEQVPFQENVRALTNDENETTGYMLIGKELATKRLVDELQGRLEEYAKEAEKLKTESDLKTQFIYNVSHELKTPITNIIGFSKLLLKGEFGTITEEEERNIRIIIEESNRLLQLIQQILDVAKLSSGRIKLDLQKVNLKELAENPSIKSLGEVAVNKGLEFGFDVDYNVPEIDADPNRLIQVFVNLVGNATKFTEKGGITVKVSRKGKSVRVEVKDTGIGISREDRARLFKRFYQLQKKGLTRQEGAGTGLGLSIVREIVNLHGGRVGVNSEPGKGSTFWFTLPIYGRQRKKQQNA